jgi:hypothetical protein
MIGGGACVAARTPKPGGDKEETSRAESLGVYLMISLGAGAWWLVQALTHVPESKRTTPAK